MGSMASTLPAAPATAGPAGEEPLGDDIVETLRRETAGLASCSGSSSGGQQLPLAHFNNAGCSLPPRCVLDTQLDYIRLEAELGGYEAQAELHRALEHRPYEALAQLLNCSPDEIAIVTSATAAWQQVVYGLAWGWTQGDRLLTSVAEYGSNYIAYLQLAKRTGVKIEVVPETPEGDIDLSALEAMITQQGERAPVLIAITHIPTSSGRVYDAVGVGVLARRHGILYMLDACQSVGQMPIDVQAIGCDFLSATSRKYLRGPRGAGFLYCSRDVLDRFEPMAVDNVGARWVAAEAYQLQPTAKRFESYEMSFAAKAGLGAAAEYALLLKPERTWPRIQRLAVALRARLAALPRVAAQDRGRTLCGLVSFTVDGCSAERVRAALAARRINVSVSAVGSSRIDFEARGLREVVRASVHYYNTGGELDRLAEAVAEL